MLSVKCPRARLFLIASWWRRTRQRRAGGHDLVPFRLATYRNVVRCRWLTNDEKKLGLFQDRPKPARKRELSTEPDLRCLYGNFSRAGVDFGLGDRTDRMIDHYRDRALHAESGRVAAKSTMMTYSVPVRTENYVRRSPAAPQFTISRATCTTVRHASVRFP